MAESKELLDSFFNILRKMKKEWRRQLYELNDTQYLILKALRQNGPQKASDLAELIQMTPGAITGASDKLVSEGYAERIRTDEDRRVVYLEITPEGTNIIDTMMQNLTKITEKFFEGLSTEDTRHLLRIFEHVSDNLDQLGSQVSTNKIID